MNMLVLILGIVVFLGIHSVRMLAPQWRLDRIAAMGEGTWKGVYSLVSLAGLVLLIWGYVLARPLAPVIYVTPFWMVHLTILLMALALISLMVSNLKPGKLKPILKHPMLLAVKIWAMAHLLVNGDLASVLLFGGFLAWAVVDRISEKKRLQAGLTRNPVAGPVKWDVVAVVGGTILYLAFVLVLHKWLIGVPPIVGM